MNKHLTVSELTEQIRSCLEGSFSVVCVEGEISNCRPASSGHLYFSLKDSGAKIDAVMFRNRLRTLTFEPKDGMLLRIRGSLSVYAPRGTYSIVCEEMEIAGSGVILAMLEKRKQKLAAEGLFDSERKKALPRFPGTVAVVSSPTGAAVRDILNILERRAAGIKVVILPAPVQGEEAACIIASRIRQANQWNKQGLKFADVLIVGRGGGSLEDLLPFSEEEVVRAVAESDIPVVSAVGHEIDWALCDFAADLRAPTPSAAAELVSENYSSVANQISAMADNIRNIIQAKIERAGLLLKPFAPQDMEYRFRSILQPRLVRLDDAKEALIDAVSEKCAVLRGRIGLAAAVLEAGSPLAAMERGFSVVTDSSGAVIRNAADAKKGDLLTVRPLKGVISATVEDISN
ncbi:MAG: exodeoxyribonuclease VII large subunit [Treponema sp.]|jgi:exodeoxyribonuclease VII large subunit|nr:exodeoxyribonuclease VII large subunit [Treponema sp.]